MRVFLCEKPSQGKDIARVLGAGQRGNGCYSGAGVVVTWCIGHLVEAVPPEGYGEQYKRWAIEQLPILPERWRVEPKAATAAQFKLVQQLVAKAGELVIATDADREGEMDSMTVQIESPRAADAEYATSVAEALKLRGRIEIVAPGSLPNDGLVIEDRRKYD